MRIFLTHMERNWSPISIELDGDVYTVQELRDLVQLKKLFEISFKAEVKPGFQFPIKPEPVKSAK